MLNLGKKYVILLLTGTVLNNFLKLSKIIFRTKQFYFGPKLHKNFFKKFLLIIQPKFN